MGFLLLLHKILLLCDATMVACAALVLALVAATLVYLLYNYSRLKSIPGPALAAFTDAWWVIAQRSSPSGNGRFLIQLHRKYGAAVRLGPAFVSLSNARDIAKAYRSQLENELIQRDLDGHLSHHRAARYEDANDNALCNLVQTLRRYRIVNLNTSLRFFAEEIVTGRVIYNHPHPAAPNNSDQCLPSFSVFRTMEEILLRGPVSLLKRERLSCYGISGDISAPIYATDLGHTQRIETLPRLADSMPHGSAFAISIQDITDTFVLMFSLFLDCPDILCKLRNEIDNMPQLRNCNSVPYLRDVADLLYLDAAFKEAMRLVLLQSHLREIRLSSSIVDTSNQHIPGGTVLSWHPGVVQTIDSIYGNDPQTFRPERWLTANRPGRVLMEEYLLPFTPCRAYYPELEGSWLQLKKSVVVLLRELDYHFRLGNTTLPMG
ncbi:cytochrome P450 [Aspergillus multicolor]|uniref:putative cytochrome P450 monooxygenase n=1 Tax=Aspergillus multicolor TaxID=41759 RepID=UPI003CCD8E22